MALDRRSFLKFLGLAPAAASAKPAAAPAGEHFPKTLLKDLPPSPKVNAFQRAVAVSTVAPSQYPMHGTATYLGWDLSNGPDKAVLGRFALENDRMVQVGVVPIVPAPPVNGCDGDGGSC